MGPIMPQYTGANAVMAPEPYEEIAALRELVREQDEEMERLRQVVIHLQKERRELRAALSTSQRGDE